MKGGKPTADEIQRVSAYWRWVKDVSCEHPEVCFDSSNPSPSCTECGHPVRWMSEIQIEEARES